MPEYLEVPTFYGVTEAAEILGCSKDHVYDLVSDGRLPRIKHGRGFRWTLDEIMTARVAPPPKSLDAHVTRARDRRGARRRRECHSAS